MSVVREWWRRCRRWLRFVPLFVRGLFPVAGVSLVIEPGDGCRVGGATCLVVGRNRSDYLYFVRGRVAAWACARVCRGLFARDLRTGVGVSGISLILGRSDRRTVAS